MEFVRPTILEHERVTSRAMISDPESENTYYNNKNADRNLGKAFTLSYNLLQGISAATLLNFPTVFILNLE